MDTTYGLSLLTHVQVRMSDLRNVLSVTTKPNSELFTNKTVLNSDRSAKIIKAAHFGLELFCFEM